MSFITLSSTELQQIVDGTSLSFQNNYLIQGNEIEIFNFRASTIDITFSPIYEKVIFRNVEVGKLNIRDRKTPINTKFVNFESLTASDIDLKGIFSIEFCFINIHVTGKFSIQGYLKGLLINNASNDKLLINRVHIIKLLPPRSITGIVDPDLPLVLIEFSGTIVNEIFASDIDNVKLNLSDVISRKLLTFQAFSRSLIFVEDGKYNFVSLKLAMSSLLFKGSDISAISINVSDIAKLYANDECLLHFETVTIEHFQVIGSRGIKNLVVDGSSAIRNSIFRYVESEEIHILNSRMGEVLFYLTGSKFDLLRIEGETRDSQQIDVLTFVDGTLSSGLSTSKQVLKLGNIQLYSLNFLSIVNIANVFVSGITRLREPTFGMYSFYNKFSGELRDKFPNYYDKTSNNLAVVMSDLGDINFISSDLSEFRLHMISSKIVDIFLSGTKLPVALTGRWSDRQIGYGQLKKVYDSMGDSVSTSFYLSQELDSHFHNLLTPFWGNLRRKFQDLISLSLNKMSNDFNQSWFRAFFVGFCVVLPLIYYWYCTSLGYYLVDNPSNEDYERFWRLFYAYPEFLLPLHKSGFFAKYVSGISEECLPPKSLSIEFIGRVFSAYFIYQFVQAFRKFGKGGS